MSTERPPTAAERTDERVHVAAIFQVSIPEPFNFSRPEEWSKWIRRFERFRIASGLATRDDETQVNTLIYAMGDEADDIFRSFSLSEEDRKSYAAVKAKFDSHFVQRRNIIYERARFNQRVQEDGEPVEVFITALYSLAEHCQYGSLHDEMIRDRIVVGIRNSALSEKLQLDATLTLQKAIQEARNSETVKQQQPFLRGKPDTPVGAVLTGSASRFTRGSQNSVATNPHSASSRCTRCGRHPAHDQAQCPARYHESERHPEHS